MITEYTAESYDIGDKVVISERLDNDITIDEVKEFIGKEASIVGYHFDGYKIDVDGGRWIWYDFDLDPIEQLVKDDIQDIGLLDFLGVL